MDAEIASSEAAKRASTGRPSLAILAALASVYFFGGTNYIAIAFNLDAIPPFPLLAIRFLLAGFLLTLVTLVFGRPTLSRRTIANAAVVGLLLIGGSFIGISLAQLSLDAGLVAALIATAPLWAAILLALRGRPPLTTEWAGVGLGIIGVALLALDSSIQATPTGALFAVAGAASMAVGTVLSQRLALPKPLPASAIQMLACGLLFTLLSLIKGEALPSTIDLSHWLVIGYQAVFCSAVTFGLFTLLLSRVRVPLAMSFAYVNPVVAVILGALLLGETVTSLRGIAMAVTLLGVVLITSGRRVRTS